MIVSFGGRMCAGKTTAAKYLLETHMFDSIESFAAKLKECVNKLRQGLVEHGWIPPPGYDVEAKDRWLLQFVGTDICRDIDTDIWAKYLVNKVMSDNKFVAIDDMRFNNEADLLLSRANAVIIRIDTDEDVRRERVVRLYGQEQWEKCQNHASETSLTVDPHFIIDNSGRMSDFCVKLDRIMGYVERITADIGKIGTNNRL